MIAGVGEDNTFAGLTLVRELYLSKNPLGTLPESTFYGMRSLQYVTTALAIVGLSKL